MRNLRDHLSQRAVGVKQSAVRDVFDIAMDPNLVSLAGGNPWLADLERDRLNHNESGITALGAPGVTLVVQITGESVWSRNVRLLAFSAGAP